jgi:hypothetical protein
MVKKFHYLWIIDFRGDNIMTVLASHHFDVLSYVKRSKELGVPEPVAEYQARQIEQSIDIAVNTARQDIENKELANKKDIKELELKIEQTRTEIAKASIRTIIWVAVILGAYGVFFLGVLAKGFHWI